MNFRVRHRMTLPVLGTLRGKTIFGRKPVPAHTAVVIARGSDALTYRGRPAHRSRAGVFYPAVPGPRTYRFA